MSVEFMHPLRLIALPVCAATLLMICILRKSHQISMYLPPRYQTSLRSGSRAPCCRVQAPVFKVSTMRHDQITSCAYTSGKGFSPDGYHSVGTKYVAAGLATNSSFRSSDLSTYCPASEGNPAISAPPMKAISTIRAASAARLAPLGIVPAFRPLSVLSFKFTPSP